MRSLYVVVASFLLVLLSACGEKVAFALAPTAMVTVYDMDTRSERSIQPKSDIHERLGFWAARNQDGWKPYFATPPAQGIIVRSDNLDIQFIGEHALLHSRQGIFIKKVTPSEYAFLSS